ncbi:MAG TPA: NAD(P)H-dependent oxidoreductase subunit E [Bdellovibrionota bacterium]|nr:NAD(P)H-dependent oxidoreductase subunit E [Bdellovibrionota bacterium]
MNSLLSPKVKKQIDELLGHYPNKRAALIPALTIIEEDLGFISQEAKISLAEYLDLPPVEVQEVITFYGMLHDIPLGKTHFKVCRTLSCALAGGETILEYLRDRLGVGPLEVTPDGNFSYEAVECLGSCDTAPILMVGKDYFERITQQQLDTLLRKGGQGG